VSLFQGGILTHVLEISAIRRLVIGCDLKALVEQVVFHCRSLLSLH
jgi:hypothetical protein